MTSCQKGRLIQEPASSLPSSCETRCCLPSPAFPKVRPLFLKRPLSVTEVRTWLMSQQHWAFKRKYLLCIVQPCGGACFVQQSIRRGKHQRRHWQCDRSTMRSCGREE